jgi:2-polyprenyl-3-methyl-5-hydroxy-6-metoxy-1,4-benzoquinol methylase
VQVSCSICGSSAADRQIKSRGGRELTLWHCDPCDFDFLSHDPSRDLAANKLDDSRLKAAGLDIPTRERDFANGLAQSRPYIEEYLEPSDKGANVLEIGCSWGYFLKLALQAGASPFGVEINAVRARYVNDEMSIPCEPNLDAWEARGVRFRKIFMFYVLEYIPEPVAYLQRLVNMLEEGGSLVVVTPSLSDPLKDLWGSDGFRRFFYDEHAINYLTPRTAERMLDRLHKRAATVLTRQGYSFVNHISWFLTNAPRTTGVVGGDNFVPEIIGRLRSESASVDRGGGGAGLGGQLADAIARFDLEYRALLEKNQYGNQIRFMIAK